MDNKITIGSRGSKLSLAYANKVKDHILNTDQSTVKEIEIETIKTSGDLFQNKKISEIGGKNLFCKEIEESLIKKALKNSERKLDKAEQPRRQRLTRQLQLGKRTLIKIYLRISHLIRLLH